MHRGRVIADLIEKGDALLAKMERALPEELEFLEEQYVDFNEEVNELPTTFCRQELFDGLSTRMSKELDRLEGITDSQKIIPYLGLMVEEVYVDDYGRMVPVDDILVVEVMAQSYGSNLRYDPNEIYLFENGDREKFLGKIMGFTDRPKARSKSKRARLIGAVRKQLFL